MPSWRWRNTKNGYGLGAITAHWITVAAVLVLYPLGLYIISLTYYDPAYRIIPHWHKSLGMLLVIGVLLRLVWRLTNQRPHELSEHKLWERRLARGVHTVLYALLFVVPFTGYLISTADGRSVSVFGWFEVPALVTGLVRNQEDVAGLWHFWLATALIALVGLHALGALKHHFIDRDSTLKRMIKPTKES